ncbi:hypothetical protein [Promicromonospora iranensis]|uniref:Uncharacterized protein n=1 Tax=Promicromonospora iranensis TaxID=1105144 RepID=A0ABU2CU18_9MICO|nr:hypothetical protein [Promicromonospora iranensis]MDR7384849.1 hypothetical protein [Promicromonospora iranensis]
MLSRQNRLLATGKIVLLRFKPTDNDRQGGIGAVVAAHLAELGSWTPSPAPESTMTALGRLLNPTQ